LDRACLAPGLATLHVTVWIISAEGRARCRGSYRLSRQIIDRIKNPSDNGETYNIGGYYDSTARPNLANPKIFDEGLYGLYAEAAQQIIKWVPDHLTALALFGVFTVSDQNTAKFKMLMMRDLLPAVWIDSSHTWIFDFHIQLTL
jgi:hypothetical protein